MNVLVIDNEPAAGMLVRSIQRHLSADDLIRGVSPAPQETPHELGIRATERVLTDWNESNVVLVVQANMHFSLAPRSYCPGLDVLEEILAHRHWPAVVLSPLERPIEYSESNRLNDELGKPLLHHHTIANERLPLDVESIVEKIRLVSRWPAPDEHRSKAFRVARYGQRFTALRHRHANLRAALRMLEGVSRLGLLTRNEFLEIIEQLKSHNTSATHNLSQLQSDAREIPWPYNPIQPQPLAKRVLLIDDEAHSSAWMRIIAPVCRSLGAELDSAITPFEAEARLRDSYDAVVLDLHYLNIEDPPEPLETLRLVREANPFLPIIIFTTVKEGRSVRDLSQEAFHYFFKETEEAPGADTLRYAQKLRDVLRSALDRSLPELLRGIVRMSLPENDDDRPAFRRARNLLELAASSINHPEVAVSLITGSVMESKLTLGSPQLGTPWSYLEARFRQIRGARRGLRVTLWDLIRRHRNYAAHYEERLQPPQTVVDSIVYLLSAIQFTADLRSIVAGNGLSSVDQSDLLRLIRGLGRLAHGVSQLVESPEVFGPGLMRMLEDLEFAGETKIRDAAESIRNALRPQREGTPRQEDRVTAAWRKVGGKEVYAPDEKRSPFADLLEAWLGVGPAATLPNVDWENGRELAPYLFYVCIFFMLERAAQLSR